MKKSRLLGAVCACAIGFSSHVTAATLSYGAWVINSISGTGLDGAISVSWYLPSNGSGDFTQGSVLTGTKNSSTNYGGNAVRVYLGDNTNLFTSWSMRNSSSIWLYGSASTLPTTTDFYIYAGLIDPTIISDASIFTYSTTPLWTPAVGTTIFFKEVVSSPPVPPVPIPPALYLFGSGLLGLIGMARRKAA